MTNTNIAKLFLTLFTLLPAIAFAHSETDGNGFMAGVMHPILGYDHLLAMLCVGIVSAQLGGRQIWIIPSLFVTFMVTGGILGANGILFPFVEVSIALSVIVLGLMIVYAHKAISIVPIMLFVMFFGIAHGHAHGVEMPNSASPAFYSFGFVTSTSSIHLVGVVIGHFLTNNERLRRGLTFIGASVSTAGFIILISLSGIA